MAPVNHPKTTKPALWAGSFVLGHIMPGWNRIHGWLREVEELRVSLVAKPLRAA